MTFRSGGWVIGRRGALAFAAAWLTACSAAGLPYDEHPAARDPVPREAARLTLFRLDDTVQLALRSARLSLDGAPLGELTPGGFLVAGVATGPHVLRADMWDAPGGCSLAFEIAGGTDAFFQIMPRSEALIAGSPGALLGGIPGAEIAGLVVLAGGMAAESAGKTCGGAFAIRVVEPETARGRLADLREAD